MGDSFPNTVTLPQLRYRLGTEPQGAAVIKTFSKMEVITNVKKLIGIEEFQSIQNSFLGPVIRVSQKDLQFSRDLVHHLLKRSILTKNKNELWFHLGGQPMRFSLREFHMVTGLNCSGEISEDSQEDIYDCHSLQELEDQIKKTREKSKRSLLGMLLIIEAVFLAKNASYTFPNKNLRTAESMDLFLYYPWGRDSYIILKKSVDDAVEKRLSLSSYDLHGFPMALFIWALSSVPLLQKRFRSYSFTDDGFLCERFFKTQSGSLELIQSVEESEELKVKWILPSLNGQVEDTYSTTEDSSDPEISSMLELIKQGCRITKENWNEGFIDTYDALDQIATQFVENTDQDFDKKAIIEMIEHLGSDFKEHIDIILRRVSALEGNIRFVHNSPKRGNGDPPSNENLFQSPQDFTIPNHSPKIYTCHQRPEADRGESSKSSEKSVTEVLEIEPVVQLNSTYDCSTTELLGSSNPSPTTDKNRLSQHETPTSSFSTIEDTKSQKRTVNEIYDLLFRKPLAQASAPKPNEKLFPDDYSHAPTVEVENNTLANALYCAMINQEKNQDISPDLPIQTFEKHFPDKASTSKPSTVAAKKKDISPPTFDLQLFSTPPEELGESSNMELEEDKKKKHLHENQQEMGEPSNMVFEEDKKKKHISENQQEMGEPSNMLLEEDKKMKHRPENQLEMGEPSAGDNIVPLKKRKHNQNLLPSPPQVFLRRSTRTITVSNQLTTPFRAARNPALEKTPEVHPAFHPFLSPNLMTTDKLTKWKQSKRKPTIKVGDKFVDPAWFIQLETPQRHITFQHIDAALMMLQSRRKSDPAYFHNNSLPKAAFLNSRFINEVYTGYAAFKRNPEQYVFREGLIDQLRDVGAEVEFVYSAAYSNHWLGLCIDLKRREITVLECELEGSKWNRHPTHVLYLTEMLPYLFSKVPEWRINDVTQYNITWLDKCIPKTRYLCNCSIFALKMVECHSMGIKDMREISDNHEEDIRIMLAVGIFEEVAER